MQKPSGQVKVVSDAKGIRPALKSGELRLGNPFDRTCQCCYWALHNNHALNRFRKALVCMMLLRLL